jgi:hypothetical protein
MEKKKGKDTERDMRLMTEREREKERKAEQ